MSDELKCGPCRRGQHGCCDGGLYVQCECCGMATGNPADELIERVAEVLGVHLAGDYTHLFDADPYSTPPNQTVRCRCGWRGRGSLDAHLADALLGSDVLAQIRAEARAEALREAAERVEAHTLIGLAAGRAEAWDEGWLAAEESWGHEEPNEVNPYRAEGSA